MSRLPLVCRTVRLASQVLELFDQHISFELGEEGNARLLYGRFETANELTIAYVLPLAASLADGLNNGPDYITGRCQAATTMAWDLLALEPVGYWFFFPRLPNLERVRSELHYNRQLAIKMQNHAQLIVWREGTGPASYRAYAVPTVVTPPDTWQELNCLKGHGSD